MSRSAEGCLWIPVLAISSLVTSALVSTKPVAGHPPGVEPASLPATQSEDRGDLATQIPRHEIDQILAVLRSDYPVPGIIAVIADRQVVIGVGAVGFSCVGDSNPIQPHSRLHIGSVSKPLTSSLIGVLVERGDLGWDMRAADVLPELRESALTVYSEITLSQLLSHTAGIRPFEEDEEFEAAPQFNGSPSERRQLFSQWLLTLEPVAIPGEVHIYSNAGYTIAAAMAERAGDAPFEQLMQSLVFDPLGLESAGVGPPATVWDGEPCGHSRVDDKWVSRDAGEVLPFADLIRPAGDFHMNMIDLAEFGRAHLLGIEGGDGFLTAATIQTIHTEVMDGYGYCWNIRERYDSHLGGLEGLHTVLLFVSKEEARVYALGVNGELDDTTIFSKAISALRRLK